MKYPKVILVALLLVACLCVTAACAVTFVPSRQTTGIGTVSDATAAIATAVDSMISPVKTSDLVSFDVAGTFNVGDNAYDLTFLANLYDEDSPNANMDSVLVFELNENSALKLGIYFREATLYISTPSLKRIRLQGFDLASAFSAVRAGFDEDVLGDKIYSRLAVLANYLFSNVAASSDAEGSIYTFTFEYSRFFSNLSSFIAASGLEIDYNDLLAAFALDSDEMTAIASRPSIEVVFRTNDVVSTADPKVTTRTFRSMSIGDANMDRLVIASTPVTIAPSIFTPLNSATDFVATRMSLSGTLVINTSAESMSAPFLGTEFSSNLRATAFPFAFRFISNYDRDDLDNSVVYLELVRNEQTITVYYIASESAIYLDMSSYGLGRLKLDGAKLGSFLDILGLLTEGITDESDLSQFYKLASLIGGFEYSGDGLSLTLEGSNLQKILSDRGIDSVFDSLSFTLSTQNSTISQLGLKVGFGASNITVNAANPTLGSYNTITALSDGIKSQYIDLFNYAEENGAFTPHITGRMTPSTSERNSVVSLEKLILSLTTDGEAVDLDDSLSTSEMKFDAISNINSRGEIERMRLKIYNINDVEVVTFFYDKAQPNLFYVIMPQSGGEREWYALTLRASFDWIDFMGAINGGYANEVRNAGLNLTMTSQSSATFTAYPDMVKLLSNAFASFAPGMLKLSEQLYYSYISVRMASGFTATQGLTATIGFGSTYSIAFAFDSISLSNADISLDEVALNRNVTTVNPYLNNADSVMPQRANVTFKDSSEVYTLKVYGWTYHSDELSLHLPDLDVIRGSTNYAVEAKTSVLTEEKYIDFNVQFPDAVITINATPEIVEEKSVYYFDFDKYSDIDIANYFELRSRATIGGNSIDIEWDHIDFSENPRGIDYKVGEAYSIDVTFTNFFGQTMPLFVKADGTIDSEKCYVRVTGSSISAEDYSFEGGTDCQGTKFIFDPYGKYDPRNAAGYPTVTADGNDVDYYWDLSKVDALFTSDVDYRAYRGATGIEIYLVITDAFGHEQRTAYTVDISQRTLSEYDFDGCWDIPNGITYDNATKTFTIDPIYIRSLSSSQLPQKVNVTFTQGSSQPLVEDGFTLLRWNISTQVSTALQNIANIGTEEPLTISLLIGNAAGGLQSTDLYIVVKPVSVKSFTLHDSSGVLIPSRAVGQESDLKVAIIASLDPYDYTLPATLHITTTDGDTYDYNVITGTGDNLVNRWSYTSSSTPLYMGGDYSATVTIGSQTLTVNYTFEQLIAESISFNVDGSDTVQNKTNIYYKTNIAALGNASALIFSAWGSEDFTDASAYPDTAIVTFAGGTTREVGISWNISELISSASAISVADIGITRSVPVTIVSSSAGNQITSCLVRVEPISVEISFTDDTQSALYPLDTENYTYSNSGVIYDNRTITIYTATQRTAKSNGKVTVFSNYALDASLYPSVLNVDFAESNIINLQDTEIDVISWRLTGLNSILSGVYNFNDARTATDEGDEGVKVIAVLGRKVLDAEGKWTGAITAGGSLEVEITVMVIPVTITDKYDLTSSVGGEGVFFNIPFDSYGDSTVAIEHEKKTIEGISYYVFEADPYKMSALSAASYPKTIPLSFDGGVTYSDFELSWDLQNLQQLGSLYLGAKEVPINGLVKIGNQTYKIPCLLNIKTRVFSSIVGGGSTNTIEINRYDEELFGNVLYSTTDTYVYSPVTVRFEGDNSDYTLLMRYDRKGIKLGYSSNETYSVDVYVGNNAGGWQRLPTKYQIIVKQTTLSLIYSGETTRTLIYMNTVNYKPVNVSIADYTLNYDSSKGESTKYYVLDYNFDVVNGVRNNGFSKATGEYSAVANYFEYDAGYLYEYSIASGLPIASSALPQELTLVFIAGDNEVATPIKARQFNENAPRNGLTYEWNRSDSGYIGLTIYNYNPIYSDVFLDSNGNRDDCRVVTRIQGTRPLAAADIFGEAIDNEAYNTITYYNSDSPDADKLFSGTFYWNALSPQTLFEYIPLSINVDSGFPLEEDSLTKQLYRVIREGIDVSYELITDINEILSCGEYEYRIGVNSLYYYKDIASSDIVMTVNIVKKTIAPDSLVVTCSGYPVEYSEGGGKYRMAYTGRAAEISVTYSAIAFSYTITKIMENGVNVTIVDAEIIDEGVYRVDVNDSNNPNYTSGSYSFEITMERASRAPDAGSVQISWTKGTVPVVVTARYGGVEIDKSNIAMEYFLDKECEVSIPNIAGYTESDTIYVRLSITTKNYFYKDYIITVDAN